MPYSVKKERGKWVVRKRLTGKLIGTHDSKEMAQAQIRAIYASEKRIKWAPKQR